MKKLITLFILSAISMLVFAQDTTVAFINNIKAGQCIIKREQQESILWLKKSSFKKYKLFIIQVKGVNLAGTVYKRDLEITGDSTIIISEIKEKPGRFDITNTDSKQKLLAGKTLKLYLLLNPSNPRSMIASKRVYLGDIIMK